MADAFFKPSSGDDLVLSNDDASKKIEIPESGDVEVTGDFKTTTVKTTNIKDQANANSAITIASDGQITVNQNNPTLILGSNATGFTGVKIFDQWRLHTGFQGVQNPIASNLERVDTGNQTLIGSAMTESSGIFTFPMTGIYYITFNSSHSLLSGEIRYIEMSINSVISGSATRLAISYAHINNAQAATTYSNNYQNTTFDCTNTSTDKISFSTYSVSDTNVYTRGNSSLNETTMTFIRLGDT